MGKRKSRGIKTGRKVEKSHYRLREEYGKKTSNENDIEERRGQKRELGGKSDASLIIL